MSKIIESLKESARELSKKKPFESGSMEGKKSGFEMTQEQLADIYFGGSEKVKKAEYPTVIRVIEKPAKISSWSPWLITSIAFLITAFSLFSTKRIFVDIKVIDESSPYPGAWTGAPSSLVGSDAADFFEAQAGGQKLPMQDFVFEGASALKSSKNASVLTLVNSSIAPFARASLHFKSPIDMSGYKIVFLAKGANGGENVAFGLRDKDNVLAFEKGVAYPFPARLTTDWQKAEIVLDNPVSGFNETNIASMRFEFGQRVAKNKAGDTVFVKDLQMVPL